MLTAVDSRTCIPSVRLRRLAQVSLFAGLSPEELRYVDGHSRVQGYAAGEAIYHAGDLARRLYVVATGRVKTVRSHPDGRESLIDLCGPGDTIGAVPTLGQKRYAESAWALTSTCLVVLDAADYAVIMERYPPVAMATLSDLARRLSESQEAVHLLSVAPLDQRLAAVVLSLAEKVGEPWGGATLLQVPLSRDDLAAMTGAATESVSRVLSTWRRQGFVDTGRRWVAVRDADALAELRDGLAVAR